MKIGVIPKGEVERFRPLLLPEVADAMAYDERIVGLAVVVDGIAVGAIAGILEEKQLVILSFYVASEYRRKKIGTLLMETIINVSKGICMRVKICFTVTEEEHCILRYFLEDLQFKQDEDDGLAIYMTTVGSMVDRVIEKVKEKGLPFSELDEYILSQTTKIARYNGDQMPEGGFESESVDRDVSVAIIKNNMISAYIVIDKYWSDGLNISAVKVDHSNPSEFAALLRLLVLRLKEKYPSETRVVMQVVRSEGVSLLYGLLPEQNERISFSYYRQIKTKSI